MHPGEAIEVYLAGHYALDGLGIQKMFLFDDAGGEGFGSVAGHNRDFSLGYDGATVVLFVNQVNADTGDAFAVHPAPT